MLASFPCECLAVALDVLFLVMFILHSILSYDPGEFECGSLNKLLSAQ